MVDYDVMKHRFYEKIDELMASKGNNCRLMTKAGYMQMIKKTKESKSKILGKTPAEYQRLRRYDVMTIDNKERLITPVKEGDTSINYYVYIEQVFDIIHLIHNSIGHGGRNRTMSAIKLKYRNITTEVVMIYLSVCEFCQKKFGALKKASLNSISQNEMDTNGQALQHLSNNSNNDQYGDKGSSKRETNANNQVVFSDADEDEDPSDQSNQQIKIELCSDQQIKIEQYSETESVGNDPLILDDFDDEPCNKRRRKDSNEELSITSDAPTGDDVINLQQNTLSKKVSNPTKHKTLGAEKKDAKSFTILTENNDRIDIFGKFVSSQMKLITDNRLLIQLQHTIQKAIMETQLKQIELDT